jgi:hypothetical protein
MDRAGRLRQSRQLLLERGKMERLAEHGQEEDLSRLILSSQCKLVRMNQLVQIEHAKLSQLKCCVATEEQKLQILNHQLEQLEKRTQAAHARMRQINAIELASQAALSAYTQELQQVTSMLEARKKEVDELKE